MGRELVYCIVCCLERGVFLMRDGHEMTLALDARQVSRYASIHPPQSCGVRKDKGGSECLSNEPSSLLPL